MHPLQCHGRRKVRVSHLATAWTQDTLLEEQKRVNLALEQRDGIRRHFEFDWRHGAAVNPQYGTFVQTEIERLSITHPLIRTQYLLLPLSEAGSFFIPEQRALLRGEHPRQSIPTPEDQRPEDTYYVAGVDIAGPSEDPQARTISCAASTRAKTPPSCSSRR